MTKYLWRNEKWIDKATGKEAPKENNWKFGKGWGGYVASDYAQYQCPVTGTMIEGRAAHRENLKRTGCRLLEPGEKERNTKRGREYVDAKLDAAVDKAVDEVARDYLV